MAVDVNSIFHELTRVATFSNYPVGDTLSPLTQARAGLIYAGTEFKVFCPLCKIEFEKFRQGEDPIEEHMRHSPHCPLAVQAATETSLPTIDTIHEDAKRISPAMLGIINGILRRSGGQMQTIEPRVDTSEIESSSIRVDQENPDYELLRSEQRRLNTFFNWPTNANAVPSELAREGLFYTGTADKVRCAFCRNALHSWERGDVPREEHRKYFPNCPFVRDPEGVANVRIQSENFTQSPRSFTGSFPGQNADPVHPGVMNGTHVSADTYMTTPAVRAVLEMGFSVQTVKQIVQQQLDETGEVFSNAETLLEKLLTLGVEFSNVPSSEMLIPETTHHVARQKQPETTTSNATFSEQTTAQSTAVGPNELETGVTKKRKMRMKKKGGVSNSRKTASLVSTGTKSQSSDPTTSTATSSTTEPSIFHEEDENSGNLLDYEEQELMEENTRLKESRICKVCMDKEVNTVFLPCGHLICCDICSPRVQSCPLCRTFIKGTVKTYLS